MAGQKKTTAKPLKLDKKLILNQWMLELFEAPGFERLAEGLKNPDLEGFDADNVSQFHHVLKAQLFQRVELPTDLLLLYDQNIVRHWKQITEKRNRAGHMLYPKYFQYLSLLFTEIYLDRYFSNPEKLLKSLNDIVFRFNLDKPKRDQVDSYKIEDLNKIAFWMATGSGKTLLMHVNILQYRHYLSKNNHKKKINRIILLTPNEGLSYQHKTEFELSKIYAEMFSKDGRGLFASKAVEIIDIHKLRDQAGDKTIAVEEFEENNLVLVDEGHRGSSGKETGQWLQKREALCENGFSFEYSATFGQAVKASGNKSLEQLYAKCVLFDYSYKYFYGDGYGKEYRILNLSDDSDESIRRKYLMACLLSFYQQQKLYADKKIEYTRFLLERPLWIFVGGSVNAVRIEKKRKVSDVVDILLFLSDFVSAQNRSECIELLNLFLKGKSGLQDSKGNDLFTGVFSYLIKQRFNGDSLYEDILKVLFNSNVPAALHVENLKGTDGEIALRLGDNEPFGLISVGDASVLCKLCSQQKELVAADHEFSGSLFRNLSKADSNINILIGSKKFTEGWSSWRVSTMGLMNVGKKEGSQIIQLFGRGVRLKGIEFCLKRSRRVAGVSAPPYIEKIETLNVFGVRADYMRQFKEYLEDEGLPANEEIIEFVLPVIKNLGTKKLKTIKLKEGVDFKRQGPKPTLDVPDEHMKKYKVVLDW
ncbi:MAG: DEAD/DEAH box helicase family protein, partial [Desulfobacterales bacterium]|nr:DEAD/DEAH box helicase family protein [Desulfobacterales bacterium]